MYPPIKYMVLSVEICPSPLLSSFMINISELPSDIWFSISVLKLKSTVPLKVPATYILPKDIPLSKKFKMIGNGVPMPLAFAVAESLIIYIKKNLKLWANAHSQAHLQIALADPQTQKCKSGILLGLQVKERK